MTLPTEFLFSKQTENPSISLLKQHFPQCFDKNGVFLPEKMAELMPSFGVDVNREAYSLNWLGKSYARYLRDCPPTTFLNEDTQHNALPQNQHSQNLLIKGDNLEVLKHLKHAYTNQIKMIYIDPPYNTGSDGFVYQDDRKFTADKLAKLANISVDEAQRVLDFTTKKSNSHSAWLTFMYPRLYIARELLKDDGVIFISIDDNEQAQLKLLCDEVFGEGNFVASIPWRKRTAKSDVPFGVSQDYEWILCFAKNNFLAGEKIERKYYQTDDYPNDRWRLSDLTTQKIEADRPNSAFNLIDPKTGKEYPYNPNRLWGITKDTFSDYYEKGKIVFPDDYDFLNISIPQYRVFESEDRIKSLKKFGSEIPMKAISTFLPKDVGMTENGNKEIVELFAKKVFSFPKPSSLIKFLAETATKSNDLILDFFAGSGTTAHAVMQLNAEDGGNRQFICVQIDEPTDKSKEAFKAGYPTIFDITKARIEKAAVKIRQDFPDFKGDLGFKIFETMPNFRQVDDYLSPQTKQPDMFQTHLSKEQYHALLTTWRVFDGNALTEVMQAVSLGDYIANLCGNTLYILQAGFDSLAIKALIEKLDNDTAFLPKRLVLFGANVESAKQKELKQALGSYANRKNLDIHLLVRY